MEPAEYQKLAEVEDRMWYFRSLHRRLDDALRRHLQNLDTARVLDAGCGTGGLLRRLRAWHPGWELQGVDVSAVACGLARSRGVPAREASVTALPYSENYFDGIVCGDVLYHLERPGEALAEFYRVLKPGGVVAVNVPAYRWLWSYHDERVESKHRFVRNELCDLLRASGLSPVFATYWNTIPFPLIVLRRKVFPPRNKESDVKVSAAPVEWALHGAMTLERAWTRTGLTLPFGSSVFAVALKRGGESRHA